MPLTAIGKKYGAEWNIPLLNVSEAAALRAGGLCKGNMTMKACAIGEAEKRWHQLEQAGDRGFYFHIEVSHSASSLSNSSFPEDGVDISPQVH